MERPRMKPGLVLPEGTRPPMDSLLPNPTVDKNNLPGSGNLVMVPKEALERLREVSSKQLDPESQRLINENFWELL